MGKSILQFTQTLTPESTDKALLQRGNEYYYANHVDLMMGIQRVVITLTQAQVQGLSASEITLVASAGAGKVLNPIECSIFHDASGVSFGAGYIYIRNGSGTNEIMTSSTSFSTATTDRYERMMGGTTAANQLLLVNDSLVLDASAVFAGAGGTVIVDLLYAIKRFS